MKKTLYILFAASSIAFITACGEDRGTTTERVDANEDEYVNPKNIRGYGDREPGGIDSLSQQGGQIYSFNAQNLSTQMQNDLQVDSKMATEIVEVYYDRDRQLSELMKRYKQEDMANQKAEASTNKMTEAEMMKEHERINQETDQKVKQKLTPEQYKVYEQNRSKYQQPYTVKQDGIK